MAMRSGNGFRAVVWDYDGTLANTWERNLNVTREIVKTVLRTDPDTLRPLQSLEQYSEAMTKWINWRQFYQQELGLTEEEVDRVGPYWTPFQHKNGSRVQFYDDAKDAVRRLVDLPQGIVSQNAKSVIVKELGRAELLDYFDSIIGYEEVPLRRQKPAPEGLILCIETLIGSTSGTVLFVGDHDTDVQCASNARAVLSKKGHGQTVVSAVFKRDGNGYPEAWNARPDFTLHGTADMIDLISESALQ